MIAKEKLMQLVDGLGSQRIIEKMKKDAIF